MQTEEDDRATSDMTPQAAAAGHTLYDVTSGAPQMWPDNTASSPTYGTPPMPVAGCGHCGLPAAFGASFCAGCGTPLAAPLTPPSPAQHMSPQQVAYGVPQMMASAAYPHAATHGQAPYAGYASGNVPPAMWLPVPTMTIQVADVPGGLVAARYAGFWLRLAAWVFDVVGISVLLVAAFACCYIVVGIASGRHVTSASAGLLLNLLALVVPWLYYTTAESSQRQATPGKRLIGLRVVTDAGARISFGRANGRYWAKQLSGLTFGIGYIVCAFTPRKQALHDLISGCFVVSVRR